MGNMTHPFDSRLEHRALGSAAITATTVLDIITQRAEQRTAYRTLVNVEALDIASNDEKYTLAVELSNDNFSTVNDVVAVADFGATEVRQSNAPDSVAGDVAEILWTSEKNDVKYQYARLKLFVAGTSPSITLGCYSTVLGNV